MKKLSYLILAFGLLSAGNANAEVNVFACEPEWKSLAEEIGGKNISAVSAISYRQDPHHAKAKPSLLAGMRSADLVVCSGAGLEIGWLPILLQKSGSKQTEPGGVGNLMAADYVHILDKPQSVDRSMGDIHPEGNPHIQLSPYNILNVGKELNNRFQQIDPANKAQYQQHWETFEGKWKKKISEWEKSASSLRGTPIIVHHESWVYLFDWLGIKMAGTLEPKPGVPPTTGHLEELLDGVKTHPAKLIIRTEFDTDDASEWLAEKSGIKAVIVPFTVNDDGEPKDLFRMFDEIISTLKANVK